MKVDLPGNETVGRHPELGRASGWRSWRAAREAWRRGDWPAAFRQEPLRGAGFRYGLAAAGVATAFASQDTLSTVVGARLPTFILFYPTVVVVALLGGWGPGLLATALTLVVVNAWLLPPTGQFFVTSPVDQLALALFALNGALITLVAELYRRNRAKAAAFDREEALRQSREDLDRAQAVGQIGWWRLDTRQNVLTWSPENHRIFGVPEGTPLSYETFLGIVHPDDRQYVDTQWAAGLRGKPYDIEHRILADGRMKWVREKAYLEFDREGRLLGGFGITQDITARKEAEEALRASEEKYRNLFENMAEEAHFWQLARDEAGKIQTWRLVEANPPALKTWGRKSVEEIRGKTTDEIFGPGATEHYLPVVQRIFAEGVPCSFEDYFPHLDKHFRFTSVPFGEFFITTGADITPIKKAEIALRESETGLKRAQEIAHLGSWELDLAANRLTWSDEVYRIFGMQPRESVATYEAFLERIHPDDRAAVDAAYSRSVRDGQDSYEIEHRVVRQDTGELRHVHEKCQHVRDTGGRVVMSLGMVLDITGRKQAEEAIKASLAEKEVLLKEIHHRVKNNMQVLASLVSLQADSLADPASRQMFDNVSGRIRSMALVHEKLYQAGNLAEVDFAEYARCLLQELRQVHGADSGVKLSLALQPTALSVEIAIPCGLILNELASNAFKHAFGGRAGGEVTVELALEKPATVRLSVRDNGAGLPPDFDWSEGGTLGLRLVQVLAEQLGGTVQARRADGGGTEFCVRFEQYSKDRLAASGPAGDTEQGRML